MSLTLNEREAPGDEKEGCSCKEINDGGGNAVMHGRTMGDQCAGIKVCLFKREGKLEPGI